MTRTHQTLAICGLFLVGLWGCTQSGSADRIREMESRVGKLEEDLKATQTSRDVLKTRLLALEEQVRAETERRKLVEKDRDNLTAQLHQKAAEKDTVVAHYDDLVKKLEGVLGQAKVVQAQNADGADGKVQGTVTGFPKK
jgi:septal ring factor EnvC (AmiA/AmiB activator)